MRRQHHRDTAFAVQTDQQRRHFQLIGEIERGGRFVQQQDVRLLRQRARDDYSLFFAAAERRVRPRCEMSLPRSR